MCVSFWLCVVFVVGAAERIIIIRAGANMILMKEKVFFLARRVRFPGRSSLSSVSGLARDEKAIKMRKGGAKFFVFWLPRFNTKFSPKFLDKKKRDTEREKEMERERERERFC